MTLIRLESRGGSLKYVPCILELCLIQRSFNQNAAKDMVDQKTFLGSGGYGNGKQARKSWRAHDFELAQAR